MRIAHLIPPGLEYWSGVATAVTQLARALAARGHQVELWHTFDWRPGNKDLTVQPADAGVRLVALPDIHRWWDAGRAVAQVDATRRMDIVHLHSVFLPFNTLAARALRSPFAVSPHGGYDPVSLRRSTGRKTAYRILFERRMLKRAALVCSLTTQEERDTRSMGASGRVVVIPNGVEPFRGEADPRPFRREVGIGPSDLLAVFVGRLDVFHKGLDELLRGLAGAPDWHLALVGPDHRGGRGTLESMACELGVDDRMRFVGPRHRATVHQAMVAADVMAFASRWEGQPMALLEALSVGTPAVVSAAVESAVGVAASGAGWCFPQGGLGAVMQQVAVASPSEHDAKRSAARRLAARHDWSVIARRYESAYAAALDDARPG